MEKFIVLLKLLLSVLVAAVFLISCSSDSGNSEEEIENENLEAVDAAISNFMQMNNVPGLSIAVVRNEKLVFAKGYGKADLESGEDVNENSLFRIASLSKPITGVTIMKLIESGALSLDDRIFGDQGILGTTYGGKPYSAALEQMTIKHLLLHTSGSWPNDGSDPMFQQTQLDVYELIDWVLDNYPVTVTPGTRYAYSNFGYALLGRVVEEVSGMSYEGYVKEAILQPSGITRMQIGGNTESDRKDGEVKYYGQGNQASFVYTMNIQRMDAHGGWLASASDLARLLVRVDGFNSKADILSASTIQEMTKPSPQNQNYAKGWSVNSAGHWWHAGSVPGTGTVLVRASNGFSWVILTNTRTQDTSRYMSELDTLMWNILNNSTNPPKWPDTDLF